MLLRSPILRYVIFSLPGALAFFLLALIQKTVFMLPVSLNYCTLPSLVGGVTGLLFALLYQRGTAIKQEVEQDNLQLARLNEEGEERYFRLFQQSQAAQMLIDPKTGRIIEINAAARQLYGYSIEQFDTMTIFDLNIDARKTTQQNMERALAFEQLSFHFQHRLQSGFVLPVAVYTVPLPFKGQTLLHSVVIDLSIQDRAESHLRRKTMEQRLLLDSIPVSVWYLKDPETYGSVNRAFAENFKRSPHDIAHHRLDTVLRADMLALALASNRQVFTGKQPLHYEQWFHFSGDEPRYMAITKTPKLDDQGLVEFVVCTATDITSMQQARELLRIERDLHIALTATHSLEETLELCLKKAIDISRTDCGGLYQVSPEDGSLHLLVHKGLKPAFIEEATFYQADSAHARLVQGNKPIYATFDALSQRVNNVHLQKEGLKAMAIIPISFEGKVIACLNVASHEAEGINAFSRAALQRIVAHLGTFLKQKQQAAQVLQSQRNLESLFNSIRDMVFILDLEGRILYLNATAVSRLGYHPTDLLGQPVLTVHPPRVHAEVEEIISAVLLGKHTLCPLPLIHKDGGEIPVETHLTLGQWSGNKVIFGLSRDIGQRLKLEHQQRLLLKNEGLERMAGAIAHHFNNLMAIVAGNVELAMEETAFESEAFHFLNNALDGSKRAIDLGKSLLIYTGHFSEETVQLDLNDQCQKYLREMEASLLEGLVLIENYPENGPKVKANPQQFGRVLEALIINAVEVIDQQEGKISVRVTSVSVDQIDIADLFPAGWKPDRERYASLEVQDNGVGIDEEQMASIFDPFYSDKFIGRGLGLPLALSIVKKLGGAISVQSQPNQGSVFQVLLPEIHS